MNSRVNPTLSIVLCSCAMFFILVASLFPILSLIALPLWILATVFSCIFLYQAWSALPETARSTTPGMAVGFCFIPFFHFYWYFRAYPGLVRETEKYTGQPGPLGLAMTYAVMNCTVWIAIFFPVIGTLHHLAHFAIWLLMTLGMTKHANAALAKASRQSVGSTSGASQASETAVASVN